MLIRCPLHYLRAQIYNEDKGYDDRHLVFLSPAAPSLDVRRALLTHPASGHLHYLQGSPFRMLVRTRFG